MEQEAWILIFGSLWNYQIRSDCHFLPVSCRLLLLVVSQFVEHGVNLDQAVKVQSSRHGTMHSCTTGGIPFVCLRHSVISDNWLSSETHETTKTKQNKFIFIVLNQASAGLTKESFNALIFSYNCNWTKCSTQLILSLSKTQMLFVMEVFEDLNRFIINPNSSLMAAKQLLLINFLCEPVKWSSITRSINKRTLWRNLMRTVRNIVKV